MNFNAWLGKVWDTKGTIRSRGDTKGAMRSRKSKKRLMTKRTNKDQQNVTNTTKVGAKRIPLITEGEFLCL